MGSSGNHFCVQWNNHQKNLLTVMSELLQNNTLTDVTLGVDDGRSVECHKMILAACSSYFQTLFTQYPCKHPFVVLSGVKYPEIVRIVEFMYKGEVNVAQDELDAILKVAEALQVKGLVEANGWSPEADVPPTPVINNSNTGQSSKNAGKHRRKSSSPVHSTNRHCEPYEEPPNRENMAIPSTSPWIHPQDRRFEPRDSVPVSEDLQSPLGMRYPSLLEAYRTVTDPPAPRNRKRKMSRENVINRGPASLRTTPKSHNGSGHTATFPEDRSNNGLNSNEHYVKDDRQFVDSSSYRVPAESPYGNDGNALKEDDKASVQSYSEDSKAGIPTYNASPASEGKRYKKYSRDDLSDAIQAVREGMSANKAALLFKVPSRTLYDKIKKLGFTNAKHRRTGSSSGSACFPYGIGCNVDGSIYGNMMENETENSRVSLEAREAPFNRDDSTETENASRENEEKTCRTDIQSPTDPEPPNSDDTNDNEAEDLSVGRKPPVPALLAANIVIKEET